MSQLSKLRAIQKQTRTCRMTNGMTLRPCLLLVYEWGVRYGLSRSFKRHWWILLSKTNDYTRFHSKNSNNGTAHLYVSSTTKTVLCKHHAYTVNNKMNPYCFQETCKLCWTLAVNLIKILIYWSSSGTRRYTRVFWENTYCKRNYIFLNNIFLKVTLLILEARFLCFQLYQDSKVNKKRSFVSDETSLAAQLGALRKN